MNKAFKSSIGPLIRNFLTYLVISLLFLFLLLVLSGIFLFDLDKKEVLSLPFLLTIAVLALAFSAYLAFVRHNIKVEVSPEAVSFYRGSKCYLSFKRATYNFTYFVQNHYGFRGVYVSRYLRTVDKKSEKWKDYRLFFSRNRFSKLMAFIDSENEESQEDDTKIQD